MPAGTDGFGFSCRCRLGTNLVRVSTTKAAVKFLCKGTKLFNLTSNPTQFPQFRFNEGNKLKGNGKRVLSVTHRDSIKRFKSESSSSFPAAHGCPGAKVD